MVNWQAVTRRIAQVIDRKFASRPGWEQAEVVGGINGFLQHIMFETIPDFANAIGWMNNEAEGKLGVDKRATVNLQSLPIQGEFEEAIGRISMG